MGILNSLVKCFPLEMIGKVVSLASISWYMVYATHKLLMCTVYSTPPSPPLKYCNVQSGRGPLPQPPLAVTMARPSVSLVQ